MCWYIAYIALDKPHFYPVAVAANVGAETLVCGQMDQMLSQPICFSSSVSLHPGEGRHTAVWALVRSCAKSVSLVWQLSAAV